MAARQQDAAVWLAFQQEVSDLKLQHTRTLRERDAIRAALDEARKEQDRAATAYDEGVLCSGVGVEVCWCWLVCSRWVLRCVGVCWCVAGVC